MENKIKKFAEDNNLIFGITTGEKFEYLRDILSKKDVPFVEKDIERRIDPKLTRQSCRSIIVLGLSYKKHFTGKLDGDLRGRMSIAAIGTDYHLVLKDKFIQLKNMLEIEGDIFVDTGPLVDREVALRAGIGFVGKNTFIISQKFGSLFFIGYMLVDEKLENIHSNTSRFIDLDCGTCDRCFRGCPNNALSNEGLDYGKCISYLTQLKHLDEYQKGMLNGQIYGCDICQKVCPYNKGVFSEGFGQDKLDLFYPKVLDILDLSNSKFRGTFAKTACGWRGKKVIQRNAILSILKSPHKDKAINILQEKMCYEKRDDIIECIEFVLRKLGG